MLSAHGLPEVTAEGDQWRESMCQSLCTKTLNATMRFAVVSGTVTFWSRAFDLELSHLSCLISFLQTT